MGLESVDPRSRHKYRGQGNSKGQRAVAKMHAYVPGHLAAHAGGPAAAG
jgi:hypothetical protein